MIRALWHRLRGHDVKEGGWFSTTAPGRVCWTCEERIPRHFRVVAFKRHPR